MRRGQASPELLALLAAIALAFAAARVLPAARAAHAVARAVERALHRVAPVPHGDRWALASRSYGPLLRRYAPRLLLAGGDRTVPVDFRACRALVCAADPDAAPRAFAHLVRRPGTAYLEYWLYVPARTGAGAWQGIVVRIAGGAATARVVGDDGGWQPVPVQPVVTRAAVSGALRLAGDEPGTRRILRPATLLPADEAPAARRRFAPPGPPWHLRAWAEPDATRRGGGAGGAAP